MRARTRSRAEVRVLEPVEVTGLGPDDVGALRERVRSRIQHELVGMRAALGN